MNQQPAQRIADTVRAEMARRRVSQDRLAAALSMSQTAVSRRLSGAVPFDVNELSAIAAVLEVPLAYLVDESRVTA